MATKSVLTDEAIKNQIIEAIQDKKGKELESGDVEERKEVIYILKATMKLFKFEYESQTKQF